VEDLQRIRLAAAAVQGQHQLPPQSLAIRVLVDGESQRREDLALLAERKRRLELFLECVDAQRLQPLRLGPEPGRVRQPLQRRPAPERQRHGDGGGARTRVAFAQRRARLPQRLLETQRVHPRVGERVSISGGADRALAERGAQPRHVMLQRVARRRSASNASKP
jgi:hypothetical protein